MDNVYVERMWHCSKQEDVYRRAYETVGKARKGIAGYLRYCNEERPHIPLFNISVIPIDQPHDLPYFQK